MIFMWFKDSALAAFGVLLIFLFFWYWTGGAVFILLSAAIILAMLLDYCQLWSTKSKIRGSLVVKRSFSPKITPPSRLIRLSLSLANKSRSSLRLSINQPLDLSLYPGPKPDVESLAPRSESTFDISLKPSKYGDFPLSPLKVSFESWLFRDSLLFNDSAKLAVRVPIGQFLSRSYSSRQDQGSYSILAGKLLEKGSGSDFSNLREYQPGESIRRIDWLKSRRENHLIVREYERDRTMPTIFLIDVDESMGSESVHSELGATINFAGSVIDLLTIDNERTGLVCFSREDVVQSLAPGMGVGHLAKMREQLSAVKPVKSSAFHRQSFILMRDQYKAGRDIDREAGTSLLEPIIGETMKDYAANIRDDGFARAILKAIRSSGGPCSLVIMTNLSMGLDSLMNGIRLADYYGYTVAVVLTPHIWYKEKGLVDTEKYYDVYVEIKDAIMRLRARSIRVVDMVPDESSGNTPSDSSRKEDRVSSIRR
jgi:uncharacterized protein (DUF58 family)